MPVQATTQLPDVDAPTVNNGIEDELTASWTDVINYGSYRAQIRETGQSAWDGSAVGFSQQTVNEGTTSVTFGGLEDGEKYEIRLRTETEHKTGAWTSPVAETTAFPTPTSVTVSSTTSTGATITWTDQADNEDGFRIYVAEKRFGTFGSDQLYRDLAPNTESVTLDLLSETTYRVTVEAYTEDATVAESVELTTDAPTGATTGAAGRVPSSGPYLEIDHPSNGRTVSPTIVGEVAPARTLNDIPTTRVPVASDKWLDSTWERADCRLWIDGRRQPIETLVRPIATPEGAELEVRGGDALLKRVEKSVIEQEAQAFIDDLLAAEAPSVTRNVDDPAGTVQSDTPVLGVDMDTAWEDALAAAPFDDETDPRRITSDGFLTTHQTAGFQEVENGPNAGLSTLFNDQLSGGEGRNVPADSVAAFNVEIGHRIPAENSSVAVRIAYENDTHPGFEIQVDGTQYGNSITADQDVFASSSGFDPQWTDLGASDDLGELEPGEHTVYLRTRGAASDGSNLTVDCGTIYDDRYTSVQDEEITDGSKVTYPSLHPDEIHAETVDVPTILQVVGGRMDANYNNTDRNQAVAISNDQGATWVEATNTDSVEGAFASGTSSIRGRLTLSNYSTSGDGPEYNAAQRVGLFDLYADLDDTPLLVDQVFDGELRSVCNEVADFADAIWEVRWDEDNDRIAVEWTFPGLREAEGDASLVNYELESDASEITEKAVIYGTSQRIRDEPATLQHDTSVELSNDYNQPAQIEVRTTPDGDTIYERGTDYQYDPLAGEVTALSTGSIANGEEVTVDYETRIRGVYELPSWNGDESVARTRTVPAATTDRSARSAARILVQETSGPIHSATVTIEKLPVRWGLVEMVSLVDLPTDESYEIYSVEATDGTVSLRLGTRDSVDDVVVDIQSRLEATAAKV